MPTPKRRRELRKLGLCLTLALVALVALGAFAAPAGAAGVTTPGYKGTRKAPRTKPATPTPPPVKVGEGTKPNVLVDAAGTAHVVWVDYFSNVPALRYCRIKRGENGCDPTAGPLPQPDQAEFEAFVVAYGDALVLLSQRSADGAGPVYAYVSDDGGTHFNEPVRVGGSFRDGDPRNANLEGAVTFGPAGNEQIGLVYSGGFFQAVRPGVPPGGFTALVPESQTLGLDENGAAIGAGAEGGVSVAYRASAPGKTILRTWNRTGDPSDPAQWSPAAATTGGSPRMSSGPRGPYLLTTGPTPGDSRQKLLLRRLAGDGNLGRPIVLATSPFGPSAGISAQASGNTVRAAWLDSSDVLRSRTVTGSRLGRLSTIHKPKRGELVVHARAAVATAADGGGFVGAPRNTKDLILSAVGSQSPTGTPGLGGLPGTGPNLEPGVLETCSRIEYSAIDVVAEGGCLLGAVGKPGTKVSDGTINLNGLEIVPDPNVKILLNSRAKTFDTTGRVTVQMRLDDSIVIPLLHEELHLKLPSEPDNTQAAPGCSGTKLLGFDSNVSKPSLKGFPIRGQVAVYLGPDSACIPVSLGLPKAFGDIHGSAVLRLTNEDGLSLDSMKISVQGLYLGPLLVEKLLIEYTKLGNQWDGAAIIGLPPQPGGLKLGGSIRFADGAFEGATFTASPTFPGLPLIGPTFLGSIGGGFHLDPFELEAEATVGAIPLAPGVYTLSIHGRLVIVFGDPVVFDFTGEGDLLGFGVATARVTLTTDGFFRAQGAVDIDLSVATARGSVAVFVDLPSKSFSGRVTGDVCIAGYACVGGDAVISSLGIGTCLSYGIGELGFGHLWENSILETEIMFPTCDLSDYDPPLPPGAPGARVAQAGAPTFSVPAGASAASIKVVGDGGAPSVALVSPSGERIVPAADLNAPGAPAYALTQAAAKTTYVGVLKPASGTWTVETQAGSPAIAELRQAQPVAPPKVSVKLGGKGRNRTLTYRARRTNGLNTTFVETDARGGSRIVGRAKNDTGTIRFATGYGPRGKRTVIALTDRNGIPRMETKVGTYTAPSPPRPGRPGRVRVPRRRHGLLVRWGRAQRAAGYTVRARLSDGRTPFITAGPRARKAGIRAVPRTVRATVTVVARDRTGHAGPAARGKTATKRSSD
jgi:hypothetical protein